MNDLTKAVSQRSFDPDCDNSDSIVYCSSDTYTYPIEVCEGHTCRLTPRPTKAPSQPSAKPTETDKPTKSPTYCSAYNTD